jgi:hypothetical protein
MKSFYSEAWFAMNLFWNLHLVSHKIHDIIIYSQILIILAVEFRSNNCHSKSIQRSSCLESKIDIVLPWSDIYVIKSYGKPPSDHIWYIHWHNFSNESIIVNIATEWTEIKELKAACAIQSLFCRLILSFFNLFGERFWRNVCSSSFFCGLPL